MKILSLNIWAGKERDSLLSFIDSKKDETDVFVLQEVMFGDSPGFTSENKGRENIALELAEILKDFYIHSYKAPPGSYFAGEPIQFDIGQAIFVKRHLKIRSEGGFRTYPETSPIASDLNITITGNCQWIEIEAAGASLLLMNLHGLWLENSQKLDTPERFEQSKILKSFIASKDLPTVLIGDFNMRPEIESMSMLREGFRDLISERNIISTRSSMYDKPIKYSDYVFVTKDLEVKDFRVLDDEVSDHLPLMLEI